MAKKNQNILRKKQKPKAKAKNEPKDPRIEEVREEVIWFNCPNRGRVSQKVKVKKYKSLVEQTQSKHVLDSKDPLDRIDSQDDGLAMYNETDENGDKE